MHSGSRLTRRDLLKTLPLLAAIPGCRKAPRYASEDIRPAGRSPVGLFPAANYDVDFAEVIGRGLRELGAEVRGRSVLLKPNLVEYAPGLAINTHPLVVAGAATAFLRAGAREVVVGEAPGHRRDIEYLLSASGLHTQLRDIRVRFADLNHDDVRLTPLRSRFMGLDEIALPVSVLRSDFIVSMPKLKTHHWAAMTCSMKNLFGVVPGAVYGWPKNFLHFRGIDNAIVDLTATVRPHFTIVDAVVAMEGDGPIVGTPRSMGVVAMGADLPAVDATCARLIGLDPTAISYLRTASAFVGHIDEARIEHVGEDPRRYTTRFEMPEAFKRLQLTSVG